ncbi:YjgN family protein [Mesorhizobium sp. 1B3]|uniref:YjgN family protein n=1 Tax=Mesorhizobium sp. 1B3 TaxID=3243599 RepID=UPI003D998AC1
MSEIVLDAPSRTVPSPVVREHFTFNGSASEYFGIWIVNVLLTILTLGIYSAWAKVRRQRYFYGNTVLAGATFDYHASPKQILFGRFIVVFLLILYNVLTTVAPLAGIVVSLGFVFAIPWFVMRGLRFSARVTSYRNVRFDFNGGYGRALLAYIVGPILAFVSLGILAPLASSWMWRYTLGNVRYGDRPVRCEPALGKFYGQWWLPALLLGLGLVALVVAVLLVAFVDWLATTDTEFAGALAGAIIESIFISLLPTALILALILVARLVYQAGIRNVAFNATVIDDRHRLVSSIHRGRFTWISASNLAATIATLGLARPWAAVRMARYLATTTALDAGGSLEDYSSTLADTGSAVGSEYMDIEGFDFGF